MKRGISCTKQLKELQCNGSSFSTRSWVTTDKRDRQLSKKYCVQNLLLLCLISCFLFILLYLPSLFPLSIILFIFLFLFYPSSLSLILWLELSSSFWLYSSSNALIFLQFSVTQFECTMATAATVTVAYAISSSSASRSWKEK